ncbi:hypothetical protein Efla_004632 [Eimeria flavescens]
MRLSQALEPQEPRGRAASCPSAPCVVTEDFDEDLDLMRFFLEAERRPLLRLERHSDPEALSELGCGIIRSAGSTGAGASTNSSTAVRKLGRRVVDTDLRASLASSRDRSNAEDSRPPLSAVTPAPEGRRGPTVSAARTSTAAAGSDMRLPVTRVHADDGQESPRAAHRYGTGGGNAQSGAIHGRVALPRREFKPRKLQLPDRPPLLSE